MLAIQSTSDSNVALVKGIGVPPNAGGNTAFPAPSAFRLVHDPSPSMPKTQFRSYCQLYPNWPPPRTPAPGRLVAIGAKVMVTSGSVADPAPPRANATPAW